MVVLNRSSKSQIAARYAAFWHAIPQIALASSLERPYFAAFLNRNLFKTQTQLNHKRYPVLPFLVFGEFLAFFPGDDFLVFVSVFLFFSRDFRGGRQKEQFDHFFFVFGTLSATVWSLFF